MDKTDLLYEYLVDYFTLKGYAPTYQEMVDGIGATSKSSIRPLLMKLRKKGLIKMDKDSSKFSLSQYEMVKKERVEEVLKGIVMFPGGETETELIIMDKQIFIRLPAEFDTTNWYHAVNIITAKTSD